MQTWCKRWPMATARMEQGEWFSHTKLHPGGARGTNRGAEASREEETRGRRASLPTTTGNGVAGSSEVFYFGTAGASLLSCCFGAGMCVFTVCLRRLHGESVPT